MASLIFGTPGAFVSFAYQKNDKEFCIPKFYRMMKVSESESDDDRDTRKSQNHEKSSRCENSYFKDKEGPEMK